MKDLEKLTNEDGKPMHISMQFFGEDLPGGAGGTGGTEDDEGIKDDDANDEGKGGSDKDEKLFTQAELKEKLAAEKRQGKGSILKLAGVKDEAELKTRLKALKEYEDSKKTTEEKNQDVINSANTAKDAAEKKAQYLDFKFRAVSAGVNISAIDDFVALAQLRVTEDKDFDAVVGEMKKNSAYSSFFSKKDDDDDDDSSGGTGGNPGGNKSKPDKKLEGLGKRLASQNVKSTEKKSAFFKN